MSNSLKGLLAAFTGFSAFAFVAAGAKFIGDDLGPLTIGFWTQAFGLILLVPSLT